MLERISLFVIVLAVLFFISCEHQPIKVNNQNNGTDTTGTTSNPCSKDTVYFVNEILPMLNSNCAQSGCHDAITHAEDIVLNSYATIVGSKGFKKGDPDETKIYKAIIDGEMPPNGSLPQESIDKLYKWIKQGALNNYCNSGCDTSKYTYANDISKIINSNCAACHTTGNVILTNHAGLKAVASNGRLMGALKHLSGYQPMPASNLFISECDMTKIQKWIDNGMLE